MSQTKPIVDSGLGKIAKFDFCDHLSSSALSWPPVLE